MEGADEGDIVKTDGEFIFILPAYELQLVLDPNPYTLNPRPYSYHTPYLGTPDSTLNPTL